MLCLKGVCWDRRHVSGGGFFVLFVLFELNGYL